MIFCISIAIFLLIITIVGYKNVEVIILKKDSALAENTRHLRGIKKIFICAALPLMAAALFFVMIPLVIAYALQFARQEKTKEKTHAKVQRH